MNDSQKIQLACHAADVDGQEISDAAARVIASQWHDGQAGPGYSFVSTGAIPGGVEGPSQLWRNLYGEDYGSLSPADRLAADMLGTYLTSAGPRGPVAGWSGLWL